MRINRPHVERHRAFQIIIMAGIVGSFALILIDPTYSIHSAVANTFASLLWLWE